MVVVAAVDAAKRRVPPAGPAAELLMCGSCGGCGTAGGVDLGGWGCCFFELGRRGLADVGGGVAGSPRRSKAIG